MAVSAGTLSGGYRVDYDDPSLDNRAQTQEVHPSYAALPAMIPLCTAASLLTQLGPQSSRCTRNA